MNDIELEKQADKDWQLTIEGIENAARKTTFNSPKINFRIRSGGIQGMGNGDEKSVSETARTEASTGKIEKSEEIGPGMEFPD